MCSDGIYQNANKILLLCFYVHSSVLLNLYPLLAGNRDATVIMIMRLVYLLIWNESKSLYLRYLKYVICHLHSG